MKKETKPIYPKACYYCGRKITAKRPQTKVLSGGIKAYICTKCQKKGEGG